MRVSMYPYNHRQLPDDGNITKSEKIVYIRYASNDRRSNKVSRPNVTIKLLSLKLSSTFYLMVCSVLSSKAKGLEANTNKTHGMQIMYKKCCCENERSH